MRNFSRRGLRLYYGSVCYTKGIVLTYPMTLPMLAQLQILLFATPALAGWALLPFALPAPLAAPAAVMPGELAASPAAVPSLSVDAPRRAASVCLRLAVRVVALAVCFPDSRLTALLPCACPFPQAPRAP